MNWELILQGLELSVMGILTTFTALGLFIGTILLLRRVFPVESRTPLQIEVAQEPEAPLDEMDIDTDAIAAAISAAVYVQSLLAGTPDDGTLAAMESAFTVQPSPRRKGLGARLEQPRGRWWQPMENTED